VRTRPHSVRSGDWRAQCDTDQSRYAALHDAAGGEDRKLSYLRILVIACDDFILQHRSWKRIFENIRFVVIDEAHQYR
jgi:replicative superfamily II helicase